MKKILIVALVVMLCAGTAFADVPIDEAHFPDPVFRQWVSQYDCLDNEGNWGTDGILSDSEIGMINELSYDHYWDNDEKSHRLRA